MGSLNLVKLPSAERTLKASIPKKKKMANPTRKPRIQTIWNC